MIDKRFLLLTVLICVSLWAAIGNDDGNFLNNATFDEMNPATGLPAGWSFIQRGVNGKHCEVADSGGPEGMRAIRIFNHEPDAEKKTLILVQKGLGDRVKSLKGSDMLVLSVRAKAEGKPTKLLIYFEGGGRSQYKMFTLQPGAWQKVSHYFSIDGAKYPAGFVGLRLCAEGSIVLAMPSLRRTDGVEGNLIENSSFENCDEEDVPFEWIFRNKSKSGSIRLDRTMAAEGRCSVRLSKTQENDGGVLLGARVNHVLLNSIKAGTPMKLSLKANTNGDPGVKFMYYLERIKEGNHLKTLKSSVETSYFGWTAKSIVFDYPDDGPVGESRVWILLMSPGNLNVDSVVLERASEADVKAAAAIKAEESAYVRAKGLPPRHVFATTEVPTRFDIEFKLPVREFTATLRKVGEDTAAKTWTVENSNPNDVCVKDLTLPSLSEGAWKLEYAWQGGNDQDYFRIDIERVRRTAFTVHFQQDFILEEVPTGKTVLRYCNDDTVSFSINGTAIRGGKGGFRVLTEVNVSQLLKKGANRLSGTLFNYSGPTGVIYELKADKTLVSSGETTLFSEDGKGEWIAPHVLGKPPVRPWALPHDIEEIGGQK